MRLLLLALAFILLPNTYIAAKEYKFALVPKYYSVFFNQSEQGCQAAAAELANVECIYRGPKQASVRVQDRIISQLIDQGVDGIAVAVTHSQYLAEHSIKKARAAGIPIVTYDSDFDSHTLKLHKGLRAAYIGTDNYQFGKALGEQLKSYLPNGGNIVIQTGRPDSPNLNLRIMGIRAALSGKQYLTPPGEMLLNDKGWTEIREPFLNFDQLSRSVKQMESVIQGKWINADAFVAVGGWPQNDEELYRSMIAPYKNKLEQKQVIVIVSDAGAHQLKMLEEHLAHTNIGQNPYEMGKQAIKTLYKIVNHQSYNELIHTPINLCTQDNAKTCTKNSS